MESRGLKVSDVYCGNNFADVQIAPILNKLHPYFLYTLLVAVFKKSHINFDKN